MINIRHLLAIMAIPWLLSACSQASKGEPVSDAEMESVYENIRDGMTYAELVAAIGGEPAVVSEGDADGRSSATYVSERESDGASDGASVSFTFRDDDLVEIIERGK